MERKASRLWGMSKRMEKRRKTEKKKMEIRPTDEKAVVKELGRLGSKR